jgi:glycosyltransferase involved in cell wall biosynthesis
MTRLGLRPYRIGDEPQAGSVPVCVIVLTQDEEPNIRQCLASVSWAEQVVVIDSGSTDGTVAITRSLGVEVVEQPWLGYSGQRDLALRLPLTRHNWVYFVDADEWVSPQLAVEIAESLISPSCAAFAQRFRFVFQSTWIRHCGWYRGSWIVRLIDRRHATYNGELVGERPRVNGPVQKMANDIVNDDRKGLASWLRKHVRYAELEAQRRRQRTHMAKWLDARRSRSWSDGRPLVRAFIKDVIFPSLPAKPVAVFLYMYLVRFGILDGIAGLRFCFYRAWYEASINAIQASAHADAVTDCQTEAQLNT